MTRSIVATLGAILVGLATAPVPADAQAVQYKLIPNNSRATFKSDAPLETFVGNTTGVEGIAGELMLDLAKPQTATGQVKVDLNTVRTGVEKRDADMRSKNWLDTDTPANRWAVFELKGVEMTGPFEVGKVLQAKLRGVLTVKGKPVDIVAPAQVSYVRFTPEQLESQKRFGFTSDNVKVRTTFGTTFTNHGMQVPQLLSFKVANDIQLEADVTFAKAQ